MPIEIGDAVLRVGVDNSDFKKGMDEIQTQTQKIDAQFRSFERVSRPLGIALTSIGAAGLLAANATKDWDNALGHTLQSLKPLFTTLTITGTALMIGVKAVKAFRIALVALQAQAIATQAALGLLTLGFSIIAAGISLLVTHSRHVREVTVDTDKLSAALTTANEELSNFEASGDGASDQANNLRQMIDNLTRSLKEFGTVGEDNVVTENNLDAAVEKLEFSYRALADEQSILTDDIASNRDETELGAQMMENHRKLIGEYTADIFQLTTGIKDLADARQKDIETDYSSTIKDLEDYYGVQIEGSKSLMQQFEDDTDKQRDTLNDQLKNVRESANDWKEIWQDEYDDRVKILNAETKATVKALQDQLDALSDTEEDINRAREDEDDAKTEDELRAAVAAAWNRKDRAKAEEDLAKFLEERSRKLEDRKMGDQRDALEDEIANTETDAQDKKDRWQTELDDKIGNLESQQKEVERHIQLELDALDQAVIDKKVFLQQELNDAVTVQNQIRDNTNKAIEDELTARLGALLAYQSVAASPISEGSDIHAALLRYKAMRPTDIYAGGGIAGGLANGGPILEPTLLLGLRTGQKRIAGEAGPEWVVPEGRGGDIIVNVNGGIYLDENGRKILGRAVAVEVSKEQLRNRNKKGNMGS